MANLFFFLLRYSYSRDEFLMILSTIRWKEVIAILSPYDREAMDFKCHSSLSMDSTHAPSETQYLIFANALGKETDE